MKQIEAESARAARRRHGSRPVFKKFFGSDERDSHLHGRDRRAHCRIGLCQRGQFAPCHRGGRATDGASSAPDPQVAEIAALLPVGAQAVALVQLSGVADWVQALTAASQPTRQARAGDRVSGFAANRSGVENLVRRRALAKRSSPAATLEAIGQFVAEVAKQTISRRSWSDRKIESDRP